MFLSSLMKDKRDQLDIHQLMAVQHGAASTKQVRGSLQWHQQRALINSNAWRQDGQRVVVSRSAPITWHQDVMTATLATRGVASHTTAARLHSLDGFNRHADIHITLRYDQRRQGHPHARVHISRVFNSADQLVIGGIPTVIVPVCLIQSVDEHPVHQGGRLLAELDLAIPELKIGVECQSWEWHSTPAAQRRDAAR